MHSSPPRTVILLACAVVTLGVVAGAQGPEFIPPFVLSPVDIHLVVGEWQPVQVLDAHGHVFTPPDGGWTDPTLKVSEENVIQPQVSDCGTCDWGDNILIEAVAPGTGRGEPVVGTMGISVTCLC